MTIETIWTTVAVAGFIILVEGTVSAVVNKISKRDFRGDIIRGIAGVVVFAIGFLSLLFPPFWI